MVTVRNLSLKSSEIPNPASPLDLQGRVVNRCIMLAVSSRMTIRGRMSHLEELVNDRVEFIAKCKLEFDFLGGRRDSRVQGGEALD